MKLVIDNREPKELKTLIQDKIENIELKNLEIGDIIFLDEHDNIVLIFERKSIKATNKTFGRRNGLKLRPL